MKTVAALSFALAAGAATAQLRVTEIWAGGLTGEEATSDWFELTNFGGAPVTGVDGFFYDDDSGDPTKNDDLSGVTTIAPGESVIFLVSWEDDFIDATNAVNSFIAHWGAANLAGVQIGLVNGGSGLGGGGDAAYIFDSNLAGANIVAAGGYFGPTTTSTFVNFGGPEFLPNVPYSTGLAVNGIDNAFESATPATDAGPELAVGSPGVIPAPSTAALLGLSGLIAARRRRA